MIWVLTLFVASVLLTATSRVEANTTLTRLTEVRVAEVQSANRQADRQVYCVVRSPLDYQITSESLAKLVHVLPEGTVVTKGQIVAEQDDFYLRQALEQLDLNRQLMTAELDFAVSELSSVEILKQKSLVSNSELNQYALNVTSARLKLRLNNQEQVVLLHKLERTKHKAPVDGQILSLSAALGQHLAEGQQIMTILPASEKQLRCKLPYLVYQNTVGTQDNERLAGLRFSYQQSELVVKDIGQNLDEKTQDLELYLGIEEKQKKRFVVGQRIQVQMHTAQENLAKVPYDAVNFEGGSNQIWMLDRDDRVRRIFVNIIATGDGFFIVESGLSVGDRVVIRGQGGLEVSQQVRYQTNAPALSLLEANDE